MKKKRQLFLDIFDIITQVGIRENIKQEKKFLSIKLPQELPSSSPQKIRSLRKQKNPARLKQMNRLSEQRGNPVGISSIETSNKFIYFLRYK